MFFNHTNFNFRHGLFLLALLGAMLGYFLLADSNSEQILLISLQHPGIDKLAHYFLHMGIVFMVYFFSRRLQRHVNQYRLLLMAFILSQILGLVDELQQLLIANRDFDAQDLLANLLGAGSACILLLSYIRRKAWMIAALLPLLIGIGYLYQHSNTSELHYKAGLLFIKQENHIRAREAFLNAIKQGQHFPALYNELAWLELEHLNIDPAIALQHSRQAIRQEPGNADYLDTHGWALFKNKRYLESLDYLLRSFRLKPDGYCINYHLGEVYLALNKHSLAARYFYQQLEHNASDIYADRTRHQILTNRLDYAL